MQFKLALAIILMAGGTSATADADDDYLFCSAHFEARAIWGQTVGSDVGYINGMQNRAELLLTAFEKANPIPAQDWGMPVLGSNRTRLSPFTIHQQDLRKLESLTEAAMIYFADLAPMSGQAPLCAEDAICQVCSDVLRSSME